MITTSLYDLDTDAPSRLSMIAIADWDSPLTQIQVAEAVPKHHYYYVSPLGRRLFQFSLGPVALAFIGAGPKDDILLARAMMAQHGNRWTVEWLRTKGCSIGPNISTSLATKPNRAWKPSHSTIRASFKPTESSDMARYDNESPKQFQMAFRARRIALMSAHFHYAGRRVVAAAELRSFSTRACTRASYSSSSSRRPPSRTWHSSSDT
jgi:hypothetical protein